MGFQLSLYVFAGHPVSLSARRVVHSHHAHLLTVYVHVVCPVVQLAAYCHGELISPGHASALFHSVSPSHQGTGYQLGAFLIGSDGIKQLIFKTVQSHEHIARIRHSLQGRDVGAHERMHLFHLLQALTGYQAGQICAVFGVQVLYSADIVGQLLPGALA